MSPIASPNSFHWFFFRNSNHSLCPTEFTLSTGLKLPSRSHKLPR